MESQPQNPEFRINPENFHPCISPLGQKPTGTKTHLDKSPLGQKPTRTKAHLYAFDREKDGQTDGRTDKLSHYFINLKGPLRVVMGITAYRCL